MGQEPACSVSSNGKTHRGKALLESPQRLKPRFLHAVMSELKLRTPTEDRDTVQKNGETLRD